MSQTDFIWLSGDCDDLDYQDGYNDGLRFHIDFILDARDDDRYFEDESYQRGFDQAGEDS